MANSITTGAEGAFASHNAASKTSPAYQPYQILHLAFVVAPVVAGLDNSFICW